MAEISHPLFRNFSAPAAFKWVEDLERCFRIQATGKSGSEAGGDYAIPEICSVGGGADGSNGVLASAS
jgi:hypothetical protein